MQVLEALAFVVGGLLYLAYIACALPIAAAAVFAVYGLGMPGAYLYGLGQVLVFREALSSGPSRALSGSPAATASGCGTGAAPPSGRRSRPIRSW